MTRKVKSQRSAGRARGKRVPRRRKPDPDDFTMIYDGRDMYADRQAKQGKDVDFTGTRLANFRQAGLDNDAHQQQEDKPSSDPKPAVLNRALAKLAALGWQRRHRRDA